MRRRLVLWPEPLPLLYNQFNCIHTVILHGLFMALERVFNRSACFGDWIFQVSLLGNSSLMSRENFISVSECNVIFFSFLMEFMQRLVLPLLCAWPGPCSEQHVLLIAGMILNFVLLISHCGYRISSHHWCEHNFATIEIRPSLHFRKCVRLQLSLHMEAATKAYTHTLMSSTGVEGTMATTSTVLCHRVMCWPSCLKEEISLRVLNAFQPMISWSIITGQANCQWLLYGWQLITRAVFVCSSATALANDASKVAIVFISLSHTHIESGRIVGFHKILK